MLIETILAAFEMDEILYELRDHSAGLNCGRWDYIFSFIKRFRSRPEMVLPDRAQVTMTTHFMRSYSLLAIKTCHRRGAMAIGGMAAQIPIKDDPAANEQALAKVRTDKHREAHDGHDGTWVAHPGLVQIAKQEFDAVMKTPNQIERHRDDVHVTARFVGSAAGNNYRRRPTAEHPRRRAIYGSVAPRARVRAAVQLDGRRSHGRNLAHPSLAVAAQRRGAGRRPHHHESRCFAESLRKKWSGYNKKWAWTDSEAANSNSLHDFFRKSSKEMSSKNFLRCELSLSRLIARS